MPLRTCMINVLRQLFYWLINRSAEKVSHFKNFNLFPLSVWWNVKSIIRIICLSWISWVLLQQLELFMDFAYSSKWSSQSSIYCVRNTVVVSTSYNYSYVFGSAKIRHSKRRKNEINSWWLAHMGLLLTVMGYCIVLIFALNVTLLYLPLRIFQLCKFSYEA